ncbi:MAG: Na+/H+ antiporter NhaA [Bacteroidales bacterium]|nr:Na+/H+ antiporter NhaA [Bacteroidales bacterium]
MKVSTFFRKRPLLFEIVNPLNKFIKMEAFSGILLMIVTAIALIMANSFMSDAYFGFFKQKLTFAFEGFELSKPLLLWINDGLMAIFFLLVGLEIKRETQTGELSSIKTAAFPAFAAIGGMLIPALFYEIFNYHGDGWPGWGIPMATDIAFALGVMTLLGSRVPVALKLFLTALAIVDDIGAVVVIALFYSSSINYEALILAGLLFATLMTMNAFKVFRVSIYLFIGVFLWIALLKSGVHATVAGILLAIAIPGKARKSVEECVSSNESVLGRLKANDSREDTLDAKKDKKLIAAIYTIGDNCTHAVSPLLRLEHSLHSWVAYLVVPIFAFANAGVIFKASLFTDILNPIATGVFAGLVFGKPIGIALFSLLATKLKLASLPSGVKWKHIIGAGFLGGIGFTMSIFIDNLAFASDPYYIEIAKIGILFSSLIAGIVGYIILFMAGNPEKK